MSDDDPDDNTVDCGTHGKRIGTVVCGHLIRPTDSVLGFVETSSDPDDLQAWCSACETMFVREQEMTPAFRSFNDMCIVCDGCYAQLKRLHSAPN